jgi:hypothetical protein
MSTAVTTPPSEFYESFWADRAYQLRYAQWSASHDRYPAIRHVWGELPLPRTVIDYGSGNGVLTDWLAAHGFGQEVVGLDVSETGVAAARETFSRPGLRFEVLDPVKGAAHLGQVETIVSSHVLEHVPDPAAVLCSLRGQANWFVFEVPLEDCLAQSVLSALRGQPRTDNPLGHLHFWNERSFVRLLESSGYLVVRSHRYASAPFCPFISPAGRVLRRALLLPGLGFYGALMATHFAVLARANPFHPGAAAPASVS